MWKKFKMAENLSIARPYAKAIFEYAKENRQLEVFSKELEKLHHLFQVEEIKNFLHHPKITSKQKIDFLLDLMGEKDKSIPFINFLKIIGENNRLNAIPEIAESYQTLLAEDENLIHVKASSAVKLTPEYQEEIIKKLSKKLNASIQLECVVDPNLLGGMVIKIGDDIFDGSVRGKLDRLRQTLNK